MIDPLGGSPLPLKCTTPDRLGLRIFMYLYGLRPEERIQRTYLYHQVTVGGVALLCSLVRTYTHLSY